MRRFSFTWYCVLCAVVSLGAAATPSETLMPLLATLRDVDRDGKGNRAATQAWAELTTRADAESLPEILTAFDHAGPLSANWLRAAVDTIAERQLRQAKTLPLEKLEAFLNEKQHDQRARRLAYEWIVRADPAASDRLIAGMLDDPSLELRRDAVARILVEAEKAANRQAADEATSTYHKALTAARDLDQVLSAANAMKTLGHPIDLTRHFGFVQDWYVVGPFDNVQGKGFDKAYPPEVAVSLSAKYPTPQGTLAWVPYHTDHEFGFVDLNKVLGKHMGVVAYAASEFHSEQAGPVELRLGTENANKIWLNGKFLFAAEVYHSIDPANRDGTMDLYVARGELARVAISF